MSKHSRKKLADKHSQNTRIDARLRQALLSQCQDQTITCAKAHGLAQQLKLSPAEVGVALDLMEYRICKCQLGLFGYHPQKKIVAAANQVPSSLERQIKAQLVSRRLPCLNAWQLADQNGITYLNLSAACEALKIKISPCQLGAF